jgi:hypothetical protein
VTIPRRTDVSAGENFATRRPTVLAELPHVGEGASVEHARSGHEAFPQTVQNLKSSHLAFAELDHFHDNDSFEDEQPRQQRSRRQTRFVDQAHIDHEWERRNPIDYEHDDDDYEPRDRRRRPSDHVVQRQTRSRPTAQNTNGWSALLSTAHAQLAPFAGLIVTAALIASAGLLLLMMAGDQQKNAEFDELALPGFRVDASDELEQADSDESAPLADSGFDGTQSDELEFSQSTSTEQQIFPTNGSPADSSAAIPQPVIEEITEPTTPLGSLSFPVTTTPLALDYRKAMPQPADELRALPAVAERGNLPETEPINR